LISSPEIQFGTVDAVRDLEDPNGDECLEDRQVYLFDDWGVVVIYKQMHEPYHSLNRKRASLRQGQPSFSLIM
jgi:hypothetical protein